MPSLARRRPVVLAAAGLLLLSGTAVALATTRTAATRYRTAIVQRGDVEQLLNFTGTISVVHHASSGFPVAGTVAAVDVHVGDAVKAGQVLATLATAPLTDAVTQAAAQLAQAQATLQTDQAAASTESTATQAATATPAASATPTSTPSPQGNRPPGRSSVSGPAAEKALSQAQTEADLALSRAARAISAAESACASTGSPSPTPTLTASPTPAAPASARTSPPLNDCQAAEASALSSLQAVAKAQRDVATAQRTLTSALGSGVASPAAKGATPATSTSAANRAPSTGASSTATGGSRSTGGQSGQSPAARVTLDQAAVIAAQAALDTAHRNLAGASITSPIDGTVAQQPFAVAQAEAPGTSINVFGSGAVEVTGTVPQTALALVKVGQPATVVANGSTAPATGSVTAIGLLPVTTSSGANSYPVTVLLPAPSKAFVSGAPAAVSVVVKSVTGVLTVPDSAVTLTRGRAFLNVLTGGKPVRIAVNIGAIGALLTQVTSGVSLGQALVLADPTQSLPASSATLPPVRQFGPGGGGSGNARGLGGGGAPTIG